jgi:hypothetical protein
MKFKIFYLTLMFQKNEKKPSQISHPLLAASRKNLTGAAAERPLTKSIFPLLYHF